MTDPADKNSSRLQSTYDALVSWYSGDEAPAVATTSTVPEPSLFDTAAAYAQSGYQTVTQQYEAAQNEAANLVNSAAQWAETKVTKAYVATMLEAQAQADAVSVRIAEAKKQAEKVAGRVVAHTVVKEILETVLGADAAPVTAESAEYGKSLPDETSEPQASTRDAVSHASTERRSESSECIPVDCAPAEKELVSKDDSLLSYSEYLAKQSQFFGTCPYTFDSPLLASANLFSAEPVDAEAEDVVVTDEYYFSTGYDDTTSDMASYADETILLYNANHRTQQQQNPVVLVADQTNMAVNTAIAEPVATVITTSTAADLNTGGTSVNTSTGYAADESLQMSANLMSLSPEDQISPQAFVQSSTQMVMTRTRSDAVPDSVVVPNPQAYPEQTVLVSHDTNVQTKDKKLPTTQALPLYTGATAMDHSSGSLNVEALALKQREAGAVENSMTQAVALVPDQRSPSVQHAAATLQGASLRAANSSRTLPANDMRDEGDYVAALALANQAVQGNGSQGNPTDHGSNDESQRFVALNEAAEQDDAVVDSVDSGVEENFGIYGSPAQSTYSA